MPWQRRHAARAHTVRGKLTMPPTIPQYFTSERIALFWSRVDRSGEHWLWLGAQPRGYGVTGSFVYRTHRVAWFLATGEDPGSKHVLHTCDVKNCVRADDCGTYSVAGIEYPRRGHLFLGDNAANRKDRNQKYWEQMMVVDSKVSEDIYVLYLYEGVTQAQLAKHFKVPRRVIREILNRGL
jgi:hypothetical protein